MTTLCWTNKNRTTRWESGVAGRAHVDGENVHELQEERLWVGIKPTFLHCTQSTFVANISLVSGDVVIIGSGMIIEGADINHRNTNCFH